MFLELSHFSTESDSTLGTHFRSGLSTILFKDGKQTESFLRDSESIVSKGSSFKLLDLLITYF
jgi:hypothetical protein